MSCASCRGTVTVESYVDGDEDGYGLRWVSAWHCVHCGLVPEPIQSQGPRESGRSGSPTARRVRPCRGPASFPLPNIPA
jgi:hypothetical protein